MSLDNPIVNATAGSVSAVSLGLKQADRSRQTGGDARPAAADVIPNMNDVLVNAADELVLDIESYKEVLDESLDALAGSLSDLDRGIADLDAQSAELHQEKPKMKAAQQDSDPIKELYDEINQQLNQYGAGVVVKIQANVSGDRALDLLEE